MFTSRRKARRNAKEESDRSEDTENDDEGPVVRRPGAPKNKSKLRISFQPDEDESHAERKKLGPSNAAQSLPRFHVDRQDDSRPSYSKTALNELRDSTPSTPQGLHVIDQSESNLDIAGKFGATSSKASVIPSAAEIQEKKERRARLAKEQGAEDFIPLEDYDSDGEFKPQRMQVGSYFQKDDKDTRLVRDDEDFAEGFDEFVNDPGRVTMGKRDTLEQSRKERETMREMIDLAEGSEGDESDSEVERNIAYEAAQTHYGMDGLANHEKQKREANRPRQPREMPPIPKLSVALNRLREALQKIEIDKARVERRRADLKTEQADIEASQAHIQQSLEEAGRELEKIKINDDVNGHSKQERGLDNLGTPEIP